MSTIRKIVGQITLKALTDIESTTYYYLLQSSMAPAPDPPTTNPPGGGWSTTEPSFFIYVRTQDTVVTTGKDYYTRSGTGTTQDPYVYTKVITPTVTDIDLYYEKIYGDTKSLYVTVQTLYTDTTFEYSEPSLSSSYEAAKEAYNRAKTALELAGNINQYFWTLSSPYSTSVPAGVYVTKIPQSQFKPNPAEGNILMQNTGLTIRNGAISLASLTSSALNFYSPTTHNPSMQLSGQSLNFYNPNNDSLALSLGSNGLNFYGSSISTSDASLTSNGLVLTKGGIKAGTDGQNGFVYLSSENYQLKDATHNGLTINGHTPTAQGTDGKLESDPAWREVIGTKFGVDSEGNLYAAGANITGAITATSLTISGDGTTYDGTAAINISGYTIEIITDSTGVVDTENTIYLYPHLYHNGIEVTTGIDYSHFIWYKDNETVGTEGDENNRGRYLATYGYSYRVIYDFDDGAVGGGTEVQTRTIYPTEYITDINDQGIKIHPKVWQTNSNYVQIDGNGMYIKDSNDVELAHFISSDVLIGKNSASNVYISNNSINIKDAALTLATFEADKVMLGVSNGTQSYLTLDYHSLQLTDKKNALIYNTSEFNTTSTYSVGEYVKYNNHYYKCIRAVTTAGDWNDSYWDEVYPFSYLHISDATDKLGLATVTLFARLSASDSINLPYFTQELYIHDITENEEITCYIFKQEENQFHITLNSAPQTEFYMSFYYRGTNGIYYPERIDFNVDGEITDFYISDSDSISKLATISTIDNFVIDGINFTYSECICFARKDYYNHPFDNHTEIYFNGELDSDLEITLKTPDEYKAYTLGSRQAGSFIGNYSFCEGVDNIASAHFSHAEGYRCSAINDDTSYGEWGSYVYGNFAMHAEGHLTTASGIASHAEGVSTRALGAYSHAEGSGAWAEGVASHAEGGGHASGNYSHAEGGSFAYGKYSHAQNNTWAYGDNQTTLGKYNINDTNNTYAVIVGNGSGSNRSNALTVDWEGNVEVGDIILRIDEDAGAGTIDGDLYDALLAMGWID